MVLRVKLVLVAVSLLTHKLRDSDKIGEKMLLKLLPVPMFLVCAGALSPTFRRNVLVIPLS